MPKTYVTTKVIIDLKCPLSLLPATVVITAANVALLWVSSLLALSFLCVLSWLQECCHERWCCYTLWQLLLSTMTMLYVTLKALHWIQQKKFKLQSSFIGPSVGGVLPSPPLPSPPLLLPPSVICHHNCILSHSPIYLTNILISNFFNLPLLSSQNGAENGCHITTNIPSCHVVASLFTSFHTPCV
jgi:hypothetical protein